MLMSLLGKHILDSDLVCRYAHASSSGERGNRPITNRESTKMASFEFNTGRPYSDNGQPITVTLLDWEFNEIFDQPFYLVRMQDHARGLNFVYELTDFTERDLMSSYDRNGDIGLNRADHWGLTGRDLF